MVEQRKSCVTRRKRLDDLLEEQKKLQTELDVEEDTLVKIHQEHVDIMLVQLEGKKQQKSDYQLKLQRKMHAIERMQQEYQQLEDELTPRLCNRKSRSLRPCVHAVRKCMPPPVLILWTQLQRRNYHL